MLIICFPNADKLPDEDWTWFGISFHNTNHPQKWESHIFHRSYQPFFKTILKNQIDRKTLPTPIVHDRTPITYEFYKISLYERKTIKILGGRAVPVDLAIRDFYNKNFALTISTIFWSVNPRYNPFLGPSRKNNFNFQT